MSSFDIENKFLILGERSLDDIIDKYDDSDQYRSYRRYLDVGLRKDVKEYLIPTLNKILEKKNIFLSEDEFDIDIRESVGYANSMRYAILLTLTQEQVFVKKDKDPLSKEMVLGKKKLATFEFMTFPYMDKAGILYYKGIQSPHVLINSLALNDALTFDGSRLKLVDGDHSALFYGGANLKAKVFKSTVSVVDLVTMSAKNQYGKSAGIEYAKRFISSIHNLTELSKLSGTESDFGKFGEDTAEMNIEQLLGEINSQRAEEFGFEDMLESGIFNTVNTRSILNEVSSLRNAIGKTLSRDIVTSDDRKLADAGDIVTESIVSLCNKNYIDTIFVNYSVNLVGRYVGEMIYLGDTIYKGTPIIPQMVELIPELAGYHIADKDYNVPIETGLIIYPCTSITEELCKCLEYLKILKIKYTDKIGSKKVLEAAFEEEYVNNRHFPISDLDIENEEELSDSAWVYVDEMGNVYPQSDVMTCHDFAAVYSLYYKLLNGAVYSQIADPDFGLRKQVEQSYDHFHKSFINTCKKFSKICSPALLRVAETPTNFETADKMNAVFRMFGNDFITYLRKDLKVLDRLDTMNPVATLSSLTKVNTIVKDSNSIADSMRRLTMGHYGRICPYETPQSKKLGIVNNMAIGCEIDEGVMYTRYYPLKHEHGKTFIVDKKVRMTAVEEEQYRIADISSVHVNWDTKEVTADGRIPARIPSDEQLEKMTFAKIDLADAQYISVSSNQHESYTCTTVPFAGSDDSARLSFGTSMVKQAKGLVEANIPRVCTTGFLNICNKNTFYKIFAEDDGKVLGISNVSVTVRYVTGKETTYRFRNMSISPSSVIVRVAEVKTGDKVKKGQILISSNYTRNGIMAIGANAIIAIMTDGYNYEDGVHCSRRISNKLTSYGVHTDSFRVKKNATRVKAKDFNYSDYLKKTDKTFSLEYELGDGSAGCLSSTMRADQCRGFLADHELIRDNYSPSIVKEIKVRSVSFDQLNESDKICNRHGNKGVACKIDNNSDMPYFENGEIIDIKYNPSGIVSRMNIGQTLESSLGLACYVLGIYVLCDSFNSPKKEDIQMLLSYTVDLANEPDEEAVFRKYPQLPKSLHQHCRENIKRIRHWRGTFNKEARAYLIDPRSGKRTLTRVNVGVNYIYKLIQEGEEKIHSRGGFMTSPYIQKTESPTKGASNGGGQRMGYMELDACLAYGASSLVSELINERGNNYIARNNFTVDAVHSGLDGYKIDPRYQIRRSTEWMLELFKSLGIECTFTDDEIDLNHPEERRYYTVKSLKEAYSDDDEDDDIDSRVEAGFLENMKGLIRD